MGYPYTFPAHLLLTPVICIDPHLPGACAPPYHIHLSPPVMAEEKVVSGDLSHGSRPFDLLEEKVPTS